jgi:asparagine synthase (glutamine-hydrolysing)
LREKLVLKKAMAAELPASIRNRSKQPYRAPDSSCFFVDGRPLPYVEELLSPSRLDAAGLFDADSVAKLVQKCRKDARSASATTSLSVSSRACCCTSSTSLAGALTAPG